MLSYYAFCALFGGLALLISTRLYKLIALLALVALVAAVFVWAARRKGGDGRGIVVLIGNTVCANLAVEEGSEELTDFAVEELSSDRIRATASSDRGGGQGRCRVNCPGRKTSGFVGYRDPVSIVHHICLAALSSVH